ncbi:hypothetical protein [Paenibacillus sp. GCM10027626]|uniref:hypothetical protein n=1 Tax=Paenibacillus sp. GCM10027626 TaxID=3273411 RepID=UPI0036338FC6
MKLRFLVGAIFILLLGACSNDAGQAINDVTTTIKDQADNIRDINDPHVQSIKNGHLKNYPDKSVGDAFNDFFGSPTWKHFKAETGEEVVEFTGHMTYKETKVKARLQFIVNEDDTFEVGALSFNDVPQNELIKSGVLLAVFDKENTDSSKSNDGVNHVQDTSNRSESKAKKDTETTKRTSDEENTKSNKSNNEVNHKQDNSSLSESNSSKHTETTKQHTQPPADKPSKELNGDYYYTPENGNPLSELSLSIKGKQITGTVVINTIDDKTAVVNFSGALKDGSVKAKFDDDGWGESGTIQLRLNDNTAVATITTNENENSTGWGVETGSYKFQKSEP